MGVDFWPYMVKVLSTVKRNWLAVIPESARLGRQGRVTVQFAIDRTGAVPKLVIATPSGTEALDRAAVAGVSASNPFPPLPNEFKGSQIRLQFVFKYNVR
jgi:TonB family protein